jgi:hypothetical protein
MLVGRVLLLLLANGASLMMLHDIRFENNKVLIVKEPSMSVLLCQGRISVSRVYTFLH